MGDELTWLQHILDLGRRPRQAIEVADRDAAAVAVRLLRDDHRLQRAHGDRHVAGVGGDALVRGAEDREDAVLSTDRRTAAARLTLVAGVAGS